MSPDGSFLASAEASNGNPVKELQDLLKETRQVVAGTAVSVTVLRYQQESTVMILRQP